MRVSKEVALQMANDRIKVSRHGLAAAKYMQDPEAKRLARIIKRQMKQIIAWKLKVEAMPDASMVNLVFNPPEET